MFDISEKLIVEQSDEIDGVNPTNWEDLWKILSLVSDEKVINLSNAKVLRSFRFCVMSWNDESEPNIKILFGNNNWVGSKIHHNTEFWTQLTENRWNSSGRFSQDSPHCSSATKSKSSCLK